ncbi:MAG: sulfite exporter TauE/SafE family protein [Aquabacterium sp.]
MDAALITGAALLGLAGTPHCMAMCGAACTAAIGRDSGGIAWHLGRTAGYAAGGAVVAMAIQLIGQWSALSAVLKPVWTLVHAAALAMGIWMLATGRLPAWLQAIGRTVPAGGQATIAVPHMRVSAARAARQGGLGLAWVMLPCGLLQSALLTAALASSPAAGATAIAAFAVTSGLGLWLGPALWRRLGRGAVPASPAMAIRAAGALVAAASGWALSAGLWHRVAELCGF